MAHEGAKGEIPMPAGPEPGYHRWSRRDEKAMVFQTAGPKWKKVVGRTTVHSDTAECISIDPKKGEELYRQRWCRGSDRYVYLVQIR